MSSSTVQRHQGTVPAKGIGRDHPSPPPYLMRFFSVTGLSADTEAKLTLTSTCRLYGCYMILIFILERMPDNPPIIMRIHTPGIVRSVYLLSMLFFMVVQSRCVIIIHVLSPYFPGC